MANKTNKYVIEVKKLIAMVENGMMSHDNRDMIIEKVEELHTNKKINKTDKELLIRALGGK